ncbi:GNAT family N-acetyltransferase [Nocardioides pakistanensis]
MLWQVRALLEDRPGAMAALAAGCGDRNVNILGLQIFPAADGRVVDELVLHTPGGWGAEDVAELCAAAGVVDPAVAPCSPHALEDQPVRYLRAAQAVVDRPDLLEQQLCALLDAEPADGAPSGDLLVLDDLRGPRVALSRTVRFTDTELARAAELRRLAAAALGPAVAAGTAGPRSEAGASVTLRRGRIEDVDALVAMHARCSAQTVYRRYHAPVPHLSPRLARALLAPRRGLSMVATVGDEVVGVGLVAFEDETADLGIMVEDRWQRQGYGTRLLRALAEAAAGQGVQTITCLVQPDNPAVLATVRRAGLRARVGFADGFSRYTVPVGDLAPDGAAGRRERHRNRPAMGEITAPLVALLHDRAELREVHPAADLLDQAVRGGA